MMEDIWIDKSFISWIGEHDGFSSYYGATDSFKRNWELWEHANEILKKHSSNDFLADAISNLNKAIKLRIKSLNDNYHFKTSPFKSKDKKIYQQLEDFGIVRPRLINEINQFRNDIEHNDKKPPSYNKCLDFLEVCWYFLKATDSYIISVYPSVTFKNPKNDKYWIEVEIYFENDWITKIRGWLKPEQVSKSEKNGFVKIIPQIDPPKTRQEFINSLNKTKQAEFYKEDEEYGGRGENPHDISFYGKLSSEIIDFKEIAKAHFRVL